MQAQVLVVEDNRIYRETFCKLLQSCFPAIQVTTVEDGMAALSLTLERAFDLIIIDYQLQTISGGDVVRRLRTRSETTGRPLPPIILMSSQPDIAIFIRSIGVSAFLSKPVLEEDLIATLTPLLEQAAPAVEKQAVRPWRIRRSEPSV